MRMSTATPPIYGNLVKRQERLESEIRTLKHIVLSELGEETIRPTILKRWERISHDLDHGKGRSFTSVREMKKWLNSL